MKYQKLINFLLGISNRYYMLAGSLVCEQDWHKLVKTATPNPTPPLRKGKGNEI